MLTVSGVSKSYGGRVLFEDVSLQVNRGDRIGLVGPNGAGKSTLFSLILETEGPDAGTIGFQRNTRVGYLPQETAPAGNETVLELAMQISTGLHNHLEGSGEPIDHHDLYEASLEPKAKRILSGLSFREKDF